jgi:DNA-binding LytR/AlgR family response regulator
MTKIKVLIVDDEPRAHKVLETYIAQLPILEYSGSCFNALEATNFLRLHPVDLLLLDITMPEVDAFAFLKELENPPLIIFTTAHSDYALQSYEYNAIDYLKKPIPFDRFARAIYKVETMLLKGVYFKPVSENIELKIDGYLRTIPFSQILYFQSMGNYVKIFLDGKFLITQITTQELEEKLPPSVFIRIHKSFIVNKLKVIKVNGEELHVGDQVLPIGKTFKKYVKEIIPS